MVDSFYFSKFAGTALLDRAKNLLRLAGDTLAAGVAGKRRIRFDDGDVRLSVAALLVHTVTVDGRVTARERKALHRILSREYVLKPGETDALIAAAETRESETADLYGLASVIRTRLGEDGRRRIIEILWEIALADGETHEFEDNLIWRVAELLGISAAERMLLRKVIEARMGNG